MSFITFKESNLYNKKTKTWQVWSGDVFLGLISWKAQWRKYVFFPHADTLYDSICLMDIADFMRDHRQDRNPNYIVK
jgi:hypothetical protein